MFRYYLISFLMFGSALFAEEEAPMPPTQSFSQMFVLFAIALVFFYFILWRPEQKRRKAMEDLRGKMKKGDRVTALGIIGTVDRINENTVILRMVDGAKIEVLKGAISDVSAELNESANKTESS